MWKRQTRTYNGVSAILRSYQEPACLNDYYRLKREIEHRITELTKNDNSLFCKKCGGIKEDIFKKRTELNFCYNNNLLRPKLLEDTAINDFIKNCSGSNCRNPTTIPKKTVALTKPKDVPCKKGSKGCNQSTAQPKTEEGKSQPRAKAETSKIIGLEGQASVKQDQEHDDGGKSRSAKIQAKPGTTAPHSPVGTQDEAPQQLDNEHNTPSGEGTTQLEGLSHEPPSTDSKLGEPSSDSSHQHNSQRVSDVNCTPQGTISDQKCTERNASSIKNLDANLQGEQTAADGVTGRKNGFHDVTTENSEDTIAYDKIGVDEKASTVDARDGVDEDKVRVILPDPKECRNPGATPCKNGDSEYSGDQNNKSESPAEVDSGKSHTVVLSQNTLDSHSASGSIGAGQNLLESNQENHEGGTHSRGSSATASLTRDNRLSTSGMTEEIDKYENDNVLGILSQFFNKIPHKEYIMMGFIPMAILLLLIILMKYTPLRAIFAKKKKKKRNDINEKLQRVLFEPSNGSEEKRIPFSYSAFEYSS